MVTNASNPSRREAETDSWADRPGSLVHSVSHQAMRNYVSKTNKVDDTQEMASESSLHSYVPSHPGQRT